MPSVIAWFSPNDKLLIDQTATICIVEYSELSVILEVVTAPTAPPATVAVGSKWFTVYGALEVRYRGVFVNDKCQPAKRAGIQFRDTAVVDVRRHSFAGVSVADSKPMGREPPGDGAG